MTLVHGLAASLVFAGCLYVVCVFPSRRLVRRWRAPAAHVTPRANRQAIVHWLAMYVALYLLAHMLLPVAAGDVHLPLGAGDNVELLKHARHARHLLEFGSAANACDGCDSPGRQAAASLLAAYSLFFGRDPLAAAMPLLAALVALLGLSAAAICRSVFGASRPAALTVACLVTSSWFLQSIARAYALASLLIVLVLAVVVWATLSLAVRAARPHLHARLAQSQADRRLLFALPVYVGVAVAAANVAAYAASQAGSPETVSSSWRHLEQLRRVPFRALTLKLNHERDSAVAAAALYFLPGTAPRIIGPDVRLNDLPFEAVSRLNPLLVEDFGCEGVGHDATMSIADVGCVLLAPPSLELDTSYPFNRTFLCVRYRDMTAREPGGRWNTRPVLPLTLVADPERAPVERELYVNLFINPFLPEGVKPQRLVLGFNGIDAGGTLVADEEWISVPVRSTDWRGNRLWTLSLTIGLPEGRTILFHELSLSDRPRGRIVPR